MNLKKSLLLFASFASVTAGMSAGVVKQMTEREIGQAVVNKELDLNDTVLYNGAAYTVSTFDITTNGDYKNIYVTLEKPMLILNKSVGKYFVSFKVEEGTEPLYPDKEIKNKEASNDTVYKISTNSWWKLNDSATLGVCALGIGAYAYCISRLLLRPLVDVAMVY